MDGTIFAPFRHGTASTTGRGRIGAPGGQRGPRDLHFARNLALCKGMGWLIPSWYKREGILSSQPWAGRRRMIRVYDDDGKHGRNAHSSELREMLGLAPKAKLPVEGMDAKIVAGIKLWIVPLGANLTRHKRSTHRLLAECPTCGKHLSAGRLHQHKCK
jgi:hypothetical protein